MHFEKRNKMPFKMHEIIYFFQKKKRIKKKKKDLCALYPT